MRHPLQQADVIAGRKVAGIAIGVVVGIIVGTLVAWGIGQCTAKDYDALQAPAQLTEVSGIERNLFTLEAQGIADNQRAEQRLSSYGWVDRNAGVIHVPIGVAFRLYLDRQRQQGGTPPGGPR